MKKPQVRLSIRQLLLLIGVIAGWLAAVRSPSREWSILFLYLKYGVILYASLQARFGPESGKAWWFGFALFGWANVSLSNNYHSSADFEQYYREYRNLLTPFDPYDITKSLSQKFSMAMDLEAPDGWNLIEIIQFPIMIGMALLGGSVSKMIANRVQSDPPKLE